MMWETCPDFTPNELNSSLTCPSPRAGACAAVGNQDVSMEWPRWLQEDMEPAGRTRTVVSLASSLLS